MQVEDEEEIPRAKLPTGGRRAEATHFHRGAWQGPSAFVLNAGSQDLCFQSNIIKADILIVCLIQNTRALRPYPRVQL